MAKSWAAMIVLAFSMLEGRAYGQLTPACRVLAQDSVPLQITSYKCKYQGRSDYAPQGIRHAVEYRNASGKIVEAVEVGLVSFDVWNAFMDRTGGLSVERLALNASTKGTWVASAYSDFAFLTGVAYISRVRFSDGSIWSADLDAVAAGMKEVETSFDVQRLRGKDKSSDD